MGQRKALVALRRARKWNQEEFAEALGVAVSTVARTERGESTPPWYRRQHWADVLGVSLDVLEQVLGVVAAPLLAGAPGDRRSGPDWSTVDLPDLEDLEALELIRRVQASDASAATLDALDEVVDRLCRSYTSTPPAELRATLRAHRRYVGQLLDARTTLAQRRTLMGQAGWLSLLAAVVDVDVDRPRAAAANLAAVRALASEVGAPGLLAWTLEVEAWQAVTAGRYPDALVACEAGRELVAGDTSVSVQLAVQQARAAARLGDAKSTHRLLDDSAASLDRMPATEHPEHHFVFDPRKHVAYVATTLAWLGDDDDLAEECARRAVEQYDVDAGDGRWVRRLATARVDLALVLARIGDPTEASHLGALALDSGRLVPSNVWRVAELDELLTGRYQRQSDVATFHEQYLELVSEPTP